MSPAGQALRVLACWSTPTPAQLTELLRGEPNDENIVVLYFGTMDPPTRRALAEATRRRRQPVMVVVDDAPVAYLACQGRAEPRDDDGDAVTAQCRPGPRLRAPRAGRTVGSWVGTPALVTGGALSRQDVLAGEPSPGQGQEDQGVGHLDQESGGHIAGALG